MKLILRASVTHLGEPGDLVEVKKGYARNYLLPKQLAIRATEANLRAIGHEITRLRAEASEKRAQAEIIAKSLTDVSLSFERKVADVGAGTLYGSVSVADIGDELTTQGFAIQRGEIHLEQPIKHLGEYDVPLSLAHGVAAAVARPWRLPWAPQSTRSSSRWIPLEKRRMWPTTKLLPTRTPERSR